MSNNSELVLSAVADGNATRTTIAEATGLDLQVVSVALTGLKDRGLVERTETGWAATEVNVSSEPPPSKVARKTSKAASPRKARVTLPKPDDARPEVSVFGEFVVMRRTDAERRSQRRRHGVRWTAGLYG